MAISPNTIILVVLAFILGSIPTGFLIARAKGVDIRQVGSGNVGATNVRRNLGSKAGALTLAGDCLKGSIAAALPYLLSLPDSGSLAPIAGVAALVGHCFSPFLKFNGGKGVATGLGVFLIVATVPSLVAICIFWISARLSGYVSIASLLAALALATLITAGISGPYGVTAVTASWITAAIVIVRHRSNITRLRAGIENRRGSIPPAKS